METSEIKKISDINSQNFPKDRFYRKVENKRHRLEDKPIESYSEFEELLFSVKKCSELINTFRKPSKGEMEAWQDRLKANG